MLMPIAFFATQSGNMEPFSRRLKAHSFVTMTKPFVVFSVSQSMLGRPCSIATPHQSPTREFTSNSWTQKTSSGIEYHTHEECITSLQSLGSLLGVDLLAVLVVSDSWGRGAVSAAFPRSDTHNLAVNGARDAVLELEVHLGDGVVGEHRGVGDITCKNGLLETIDLPPFASHSP